MLEQLNIVFMMTDQHRADHVGWHPRSRMAMPNLDRLAEGCAFLNCVSANPICTPARTALLTGRYTHQIGTLAMSGDLPRGIPTYAQALQQAGYHTAGIGKFHWLQAWKWGAPVGHGVDLSALHAELKGFGFDEVWEASGKQLAVHNTCDWGRHLERKGLLDAYRDYAQACGGNFDTAEQTVFRGEPWPFEEADYADIVTGDQAVASLRGRPADKPYFGFFSFCSPHAPFDPPARFLDQVPEETDDPPFVEGGPDDLPMGAETRARMRRLRRAYKAMLLCVDEQIGRILDTLAAEGMADNTLLVFTSDHGEMLGDHGYFQKNHTQWQSATVPTVVYHPAHRTRQRCERVVELTDLTATILDAAGLETQAALSKDWPAFNNVIPCRSLLPVIRGEAESVREYAFSECSGRWHMIQDDQYKYVRFTCGRPGHASERLYDWAVDPGETEDLSGAESMEPVLARMRARLLDVLATTPAAQTRWAPLMGPDGSAEFPVEPGSERK